MGQIEFYRGNLHTHSLTYENILHTFHFIVLSNHLHRSVYGAWKACPTKSKAKSREKIRKNIVISYFKWTYDVLILIMLWTLNNFDFRCDLRSTDELFRVLFANPNISTLHLSEQMKAQRSVIWFGCGARPIDLWWLIMVIMLKYTVVSFAIRSSVVVVVVVGVFFLSHLCLVVHLLPNNDGLSPKWRVIAVSLV